MITRERLQQSIKGTFDQALKLVEVKNGDYACEEDGLKNFRSCEMVKVSLERAIIIRLMDKINRIINLLDRPGVVKDEAITDSILDAINYLAILKAKVEEE